MELLIFSDSHGHSEEMREAMSRQTGKIESVIFLGDGLRDVCFPEFSRQPLYAVKGNCDFSFGSGFAYDELTVEIGGKTVMMTHGAAYGVKGGTDALIRAALQKNADIVLFGHTHRPYYRVFRAGEDLFGQMLKRDLHVFNPGSIGYDGDGNGKSFGVLLIQGKTVLLSHGRI
jgi:putative phosphoesterase